MYKTITKEWKPTNDPKVQAYRDRYLEQMDNIKQELKRDAISRKKAFLYSRWNPRPASLNREDNRVQAGIGSNRRNGIKSE